ncbi:MAG: ABC transporter permease [Bacteroidia bacterium]|jgi:ABC-2 type transport system permease protein|nr:ABC transporter permease [Bacteroidia bacterium]MBP7245667.1 ABC transporter permease [Bacteroidia bacterium]
MNKILLILQREYITRVKKKSFIVMTILGPILMAAIAIVPILIAKYSDDKINKILVIDQRPEIFTTILPSSETVLFVNSKISLDSAKRAFDPEKFYGILYLQDDMVKNPGGAMLFTEKQANLSVTNYIETSLEKQIEQDKLKAEGIDQKTLTSIETTVNLKTLSLKGEENSAELATIVGFICGLLIYLFIFLYGVQVMRGVIEEKTNRIVEVIISSVKPFELMMGKIIGIALVGLTQFFLWIILTLTITTIAGKVIVDPKTDAKVVAQTMRTNNLDQHALEELGATPKVKEDAIAKVFSQLSSINFPLIISCFFIYFLGGYLLYSALFAAIGAAVDNETETQQFMLPVTIPLILAFIVAQSIVQNPDSQLGFWFSIFPLTSPVVMMVRIAFGVPPWELALSIGLLIAGFVGATWLAGRIYRTGILLYGKKVNYKELAKWLFYKG